VKFILGQTHLEKVLRAASTIVDYEGKHTITEDVIQRGLSCAKKKRILGAGKLRLLLFVHRSAKCQLTDLSDVPPKNQLQKKGDAGSERAEQRPPLVSVLSAT
jgi:hypothetical protein